MTVVIHGLLLMGVKLSHCAFKNTNIISLFGSYCAVYYYMVPSCSHSCKDYNRAWQRGLCSAPPSVQFLLAYAKLAGLSAEQSPGRFCARQPHPILEVAVAFYSKISLVL